MWSELVFCIALLAVPLILCTTAMTYCDSRWRRSPRDGKWQWSPGKINNFTQEGGDVAGEITIPADCPPLGTLAPVNEALWRQGAAFGPGTDVDGMSARSIHFTVAQQEGVLIAYLPCPEGWFLQETLLTSVGGPVERLELIGRSRWRLTFRGPVVGTVHVDLNNRQAVISRPNGDVAQGTIDRAAVGFGGSAEPVPHELRSAGTGFPLSEAHAEPD